MSDPFVVVGGGITGLVAARALARGGAPAVLLLEASGRLGGKIRTDTLDGVMLEAGPDSFLAREPHATRLCHELGLGHELVAPAAFGAHVWISGTLRSIPPGFLLGFPASPRALLRSGILSVRGAARALGDLFLPGPLRGPDVSVGAFVRRRFGDEVLACLVDPILAGTRAGSPDELSLAAAAPQIDAVARTHRSVLLGLWRQPRAQESPPFLAVRGGIERLVDALRADIAAAVEVRTAAPATAIRATDHGYLVRAGGDEVRAAGVVVATPAYAAADMLAPLSPVAASELERIAYASIVLVGLVYPADAGTLPPTGSGILVPSRERRLLAGATWITRKWPHVAPTTGELVFRCFIGRSADDPAPRLPDDELVRRAASELGAALGLRGEPRASAITRWARALPQYEVGHNDRVARIDAALSAHGGVVVAGAAYRGSGVPECIVQGEDGARRVLDATRRARAPGATLGGRSGGGQ